MPEVSVIIPTYNRQHQLGVAIQSVLHQTYKDYEIIVVDDGSTDNTAKCLEAWPVSYYYQEHGGCARARNTGINKAHGRYLAFLDSDDYWLPDKLAKQVKVMEDNPRVILSHTSYFRMSNGNQPTPVYSGKVNGEYPWLYFNSPIAMPTVMLCRDYLYGRRFPEIAPSDDTVLWADLVKYNPFKGIVEPLCVINTGEATNAFNKDKQLAAIDRLFEYGINKDKVIPLPTLLHLWWHWHWVAWQIQMENR